MFNTLETTTNNIGTIAMVQSTSANNIGRDQYTKPLNFDNGPVPRCAQLMLWSGFQWEKARIQNNIITKKCLNSKIRITGAILWEEPIV